MTRLMTLLFLLMLAGAVFFVSCGNDDDDDNAVDDDAVDDDVADDDSADDDVVDDDAVDDDTVDDDDSGEAEMIVNGNFETGNYPPWTGTWHGDLLASSSDIVVYEGEWSVWLGPMNADEWIEQSTVMPPDLLTATVSFAHDVYRSFNPTSGGIEVAIWDEEGATKLVEIKSWTPEEITWIGEWTAFSYDLTPDQIEAIAGQTVQLRFEAQAQGGVLASFNLLLDVVSFYITW